MLNAISRGTWKNYNANFVKIKHLLFLVLQLHRIKDLKKNNMLELLLTWICNLILFEIFTLNWHSFKSLVVATTSKQGNSTTESIA